MALTTFIVKKYVRRETEHLFEDLQGVARLGLWKACLLFDEQRGNTFSTFAAKCIENEIFTFLRREQKYLSLLSLDKDLSTSEDNKPITQNDYLQDADTVESVLEVEEILNLLEDFPTLKKYVLEPMTQRELAAALGKPLTTIKNTIHRERDSFKKRLKQKGIHNV